MANRPTDLTNYNAPTTSDPDGSIKDQVYSGGSVSQIGSRAFARFVHDLLAPFYRLVRESGGSLNGSTDTQETSQFYDGLDYKTKNDAKLAARKYARQNALSNVWKKISTASGPVGSNNEYYHTGAYGNRIALFIFIRKTNFNMAAYGYTSTLTPIAINNLPGGSIANSKIPKMIFAQNNAKFILSTSNSLSFDCFFFRSVNGASWDNIIYESDTSRNGGVVVGEIGNRIVIVAYNDANNSVYYSDSGGNSGTWNRVSLAATSPLYKPVIGASGDGGMIWIDEVQSLVRYSADGITWQDCTLGPSVMSNPLDACWTGNEFIILTDDYIWVSLESTITSFVRYNKPVAQDFRFIFCVDGVVGLGGATGYTTLFTSTPSQIRNNVWVSRNNIEPGTDTFNVDKTAVAAGEIVVFAGSNNYSSDTTDFAFTPAVQD